MSEIKLSIVRKSIPVTLETESGESIILSLKEMSGAQRDSYFNRVREQAILDAEGEIVGVKTYNGMLSSLLSYCLYDSENKLVKEDLIQSWPHEAQKALFDAAKSLNKLEGSEGDEKN